MVILIALRPSCAVGSSIQGVCHPWSDTILARNVKTLSKRIGALRLRPVLLCIETQPLHWAHAEARACLVQSALIWKQSTPGPRCEWPSAQHKMLRQRASWR